MKEFIQEKVSERFAKLPEAVQTVILSDEVADGVLKAMTDAGLSEEKMKVCNQQATLVAVGFTTTKDFKEFVTNELDLGREKADALFTAISASAFTPIRDKLLEVFDAKGIEAKETATSTTDPYRENV